MFRKIDDALFDHKYIGFQTNAHRFQRHFGPSCFFLAKWASIMTIIMTLAGGCLWLITPVFRALGLLFLMASTFLVPALIVKIRDLERSERAVQNGATFMKGGMNPLRIMLIVPRLGILMTGCFMVVNLFLFPAVFPFIGIIHGVVMALFLFFTVSMSYLSSCTPLPPTKSTVRKWYEKALTKLNDKLGPDPIPAKN